MLPLFTRDEMRALDRAASERFQVPSLLLMENAALGATGHILARYGDALAQVWIVGGEGQNGGDGWAVARQLLARGVRASCALVGDPERVRGDAKVNLDALRALGIPLQTVDEHNVHELAQSVRSASLIVDGLFGTGLSRPVTGLHARVVEALTCGVPICALDLPSGIDANTGAVLGSALRASSTVTFAGRKRGLHQYPGVAYAGFVEVVSIGVPAPTDADVAVVERADVARTLPPLSGDAHKGTRGHVLVIAGSEGKSGAALLCAQGALRAGAGLVSIAADRETRLALESRVLEAMTLGIDATDPLTSLLASAKDKRGVVLGPGFGLSPARQALSMRLAHELPQPTVLDADALTALASDPRALVRARGPRVLTPHPGEASRLLACTTEAVQADRYAAASQLAQACGHVVVLKGAGTVIASPDGRMRVCTAANPALGAGGTGDVLSGIVGALLVHATPFDAAWAAVELHALAGELAAESDRGLLASEVAAALPRAFRNIREHAQRASA